MSVRSFFLATSPCPNNYVCIARPQLAFGQLEALQRLYLNENHLSGAIPTQVGMLSNLKTLFLHQNILIRNETVVGMGLSGSIPSQLGQLLALNHLALHNNRIQGSIPSEIGAALNLIWINLFDNALFGGIPSEIAELHRLNYLVLGANSLSKSIPIELSKLGNLQMIDLAQNKLQGHVPSEFGLLSNLITVSFRENQLSGVIPGELGRLSKITSLDLGRNLFSGETIPIGGLEVLDSLILDDNLLTQFSHTWDLPKKISRLILSGNAIGGEVTKGLVGLREMRVLDLSSNQFSNTVPSQLGMLSSLENFHLDANALTGTIPTDIFRWRSLRELRLDSNFLSGNIPAELTNPTNLEIINLSRNNLTNQIPWISGFSSLTSLDLSHNNLTGWISLPFIEMISLRTLRLEHNSFSGEIPRALESLSNLEGLYLGNNALTGRLLFSPVDDLESITDSTIASGGDISSSGSEDPDTEDETAESDTEPWEGASSAASAFAVPFWIVLACPSRWMATAQVTWEANEDSSLLDIYDENELILPTDWESINASLARNDDISTHGGGYKLKYYSVHNNFLSGAIPTMIGLLTGETTCFRKADFCPFLTPSLDLVGFAADNNGLLGEIPSEIGQLRKLKTFSAGEQNLLFGSSIAPEIASLAVNGSLETFHATFMDFTGIIPASLCLIDSLRVCLHQDAEERLCYCSCDMETPCAVNATNQTRLLPAVDPTQ